MATTRGNTIFAVSHVSRFVVLSALVLAFVLAAPDSIKGGKPGGARSLSSEQRIPCAGYPPSGTIPSVPTCQKVWVTVTNTEETKVIDTYCDPPGLLPCNEKTYTATHLVYSYTAEAVGELTYQKDFSQFSVYVQGTAADTRILQLQGSHTWYTLEGVNATKRWHTQNFPRGRVNIRRPFKFAIFYPFDEDSTNNICFEPMEVESQDESENWLLGTGTSKVCWNHEKIRFVVTAAMMKEIVAKREFQKTFRWQDSGPNEKSTIDNFIEIKIWIGKPGPPPPAVPPPPEEEVEYIPLAQYKKLPEKKDRTSCDIIKQDLSEATKLRDAYKDPALLERAIKEDWDAKKYGQEVYKKVFGPSLKATECPMWTDPTTCQIKIYWDKKKYKDKGFTETSYEADLAHEKVHERNCKKRANPMEYFADMGFPAKLSQEEVSAYETKIKYLQNWLKLNCK